MVGNPGKSSVSALCRAGRSVMIGKNAFARGRRSFFLARSARVRYNRHDRSNDRKAAGDTMKIKWKDGFEIRVRVDGDEVLVSANREGLLSLAEQFSALAEEGPGCHIHYDEHNSLEEGSSGLIVERI